jgi:hypothetical protein
MFGKAIGLRVPQFTAQNAAEMAHRSHQSRLMRQTECIQAASIPQPVPQFAELRTDELESRARIERKVRQMESIDDHIDNTTDAKELHLLTTAREKVFSEWCTLTRTPRNGTFKAPAIKEKRNKISELPGPLDC